MNYYVIKPILGGLILGAILFFFPFFAVKVIGFLLIIGMIFWLLKGRRAHWRRYAMIHPDRIRSMSEEEYATFKSGFSRSHCYQKFNDETQKSKEDINHKNQEQDEKEK